MSQVVVCEHKVNERTGFGQAGNSPGLLKLVESRGFNAFIITVIVINAVTLGLETSKPVVQATGSLLFVLDKAALVIFTVEIALRLIAHRSSFFRGGWNTFDFLIVAISWIPSVGAFSS